MVTTVVRADRIRRHYPNTAKTTQTAAVARPRGGFFAALLRALSAMAA